MSLARISEVAKRMQLCPRQALTRLQRMQTNHPNIQILTRDDPKAKWWVDLDGLARVRRLQRDERGESLESRLGQLESSFAISRRQVDRLKMRIESLEKAQSRACHQEKTGSK